MIAPYRFLVDGSSSARSAADSARGLREWSVLEQNSDGPLTVAELAPPGVRVLVLPLQRALEISEDIPPRIAWIAYGEELDILRAFFSGAVDYLPNPWTVVSMIARSRRHADGKTGGTEADAFGSVIVAEGHTVVLRGRETAIWGLLKRNAGRVVERAALAEVLGVSVCGEGSSRAVDMAVHRLRRSLGPGGIRIETIRGRGYRLHEK